MESWGAFLPQDRRRALAAGETLAAVTAGTAVFADISGFTPLSEEYSIEFGSNRGAEEVTLQMNAFFEVLINILDKHHGSAISFSGDAVTCWFDGDDGRRAVSCAREIQGPSGTIGNCERRAAGNCRWV